MWGEHGREQQQGVCLDRRHKCHHRCACLCVCVCVFSLLCSSLTSAWGVLDSVTKLFYQGVRGCASSCCPAGTAVLLSPVPCSSLVLLSFFSFYFFFYLSFIHISCRIWSAGFTAVKLDRLHFKSRRIGMFVLELESFGLTDTDVACALLTPSVLFDGQGINAKAKWWRDLEPWQAILWVLPNENEIYLPGSPPSTPNLLRTVGPQQRGAKRQWEFPWGEERERFFFWEHPVIILPRVPSRKKWVFCIYGT